MGRTFIFLNVKVMIVMCKLEMRIIKSSKIKGVRLKKGVDCRLCTVSSYDLMSENEHLFFFFHSFKTVEKSLKHREWVSQKQPRKWVIYLGEAEILKWCRPLGRMDSGPDGGTSGTGRDILTLRSPRTGSHMTAEGLTHLALENKRLASCLFGKIGMP